MVKIENIKISEMLLYANDRDYYGSMIRSNLLPQEKATVIVTALKRIKYIQNALESIDYHLNRWDEVNLSDTKTQKAFWLLLQDVKASPLTLETAKSYIQKHLQNYHSKHLFNKGHLPRFVCDAFDTFCKERNVTEKLEKQKLYEEFCLMGVKNGFGVQTRLKQAISEYFYLETVKGKISEEESKIKTSKKQSKTKTPKEKLFQVFSAKKTSFNVFLNHEFIQKLTNLAETESLKMLFKEASAGKLTFSSTEYLLSDELNGFIEILDKIVTDYQKELPLFYDLIGSIVKKNSYNNADYQDELAGLSEVIREKLWNGTYDGKNLHSYVGRIIKNIIVTKLKGIEEGNYDEAFLYSDDDTEDHDDTNSDEDFDDKPNDDEAFVTHIDWEENEKTMINQLAQYTDQEIKEHQLDEIRELMKKYTQPYEGKRKKKKINAALCYLEEVGDYDKIAIRVYRNNNEDTKTNARDAKRQGKVILIRDNPALEMFFELIEKYLDKKKNDNGTKF